MLCCCLGRLQDTQLVLLVPLVVDFMKALGSQAKQLLCKLSPPHVEGFVCIVSRHLQLVEGRICGPGMLRVIWVISATLLCSFCSSVCRTNNRVTVFELGRPEDGVYNSAMLVGMRMCPIFVVCSWLFGCCLWLRFFFVGHHAVFGLSLLMKKCTIGWTP